MIADAEPFALTGVVITEVLQGLKGDDALIAAIALEYGVTLFTLDKDFTRMAGVVHLPLYVF